MMFYWNKSNFEGLKAVGEQYASKIGYEDFANYCLFKEKGLKKQANQYMAQFILKINKWDIEKQRHLAQELSSLWFWHQEIHQLISHPLQQFISKTLQEWCVLEPDNAEIHRWFAFMGGGLEYFQKAVAIDATDEISISQLAQAHINNADYITHHLSESRIIGTEKELSAEIKEATNFAEMLTTKKAKDKVLNEIAYYADLANAWKQYSATKQNISFPEWSESIGKDYAFSSIVYYDK